MTYETGPEEAPADDAFELGPPGLEELEDPLERQAALEAWQSEWDAQSLDDASRVARYRRRHMRALAEKQNAAAAQIAALEEWCARVTAEHHHAVAWSEERLTDFHRRQLARNEKANKTIELPGGFTLESRAGRTSLDVTDAPALIEWLEEHEAAECVMYHEATPDKKAVVARFGAKAPTEAGSAPLVDPETGERIPGAEVVRGDRSFHVKP